MKIYTNTIDLTNPAPKQFWVAPYSDFGIGIKFVNGKNAVEGEVILQDEFGNELPAESEKHGDGFTVFKTTSLGLNVDIDYFAIAPNGQRVMITQNVTNSSILYINIHIILDWHHIIFRVYIYINTQHFHF